MLAADKHNGSLEPWACILQLLVGFATAHILKQEHIVGSLHLLHSSKIGIHILESL